MKKKSELFMMVIPIALFFLSATAYGENKVYLSGNFGIAMMSDTGAASYNYENLDYLYGDYNSQADIERVNIMYEHTMAFEVGEAINLALGFHYGNNFRIEAEVTYQKNEMENVIDYADIYFYNLDYGNYNHYYVAGSIQTGDVSRIAYMVNAYYDFSNKSVFTPFLGGGLGIASLEYDVPSHYIYTSYNDIIFHPYLKGNTEDFAYQLFAGVGVDINDHLILDAKYCYFTTEDPEFGNLTIEYETQNIFLGIRYEF